MNISIIFKRFFLVFGFLYSLNLPVPVVASHDEDQRLKPSLKATLSGTFPLLPPEILIKIFHHLIRLSDIKSARLAGKDFESADFYDFSKACCGIGLEKSDFANSQFIINWRINKFKGLNVVPYKDIDNIHLKILAGVHHIDLSGCKNITDEGIKALAGVRTISLFGCNKITDEGIKALAGIQGICLALTDVTDEGIKPLAGVHTISLFGCTKITDEGIKALAGVHRICLAMTNITDEGIKPLAGVHSIDLSGCRGITNEGIKALAGAHEISFAMTSVTNE